MVNMLLQKQNLSDDELHSLLETQQYDEQLFYAANKVRCENYGKNVYIRGLIEISNFCKNDCYYCGIRCGNKKVLRYRLKKEDILSCCEEGYSLGFRTFVMQGGEDAYYTDERICEIVSAIKTKFADCAVTLSLGEKPYASYKAYFDAGADRYLLRHETSDNGHYSKLHPKSMSLKARKECLYSLKEIGYQVGSGFMVGSPYQTSENIVQDIRFLQELKPDMIGIGPYITHKDTPFSGFENGELNITLRLIAILRLIFPGALIPATTALGTIAPNGRELGLKAGANVVMPNLSPEAVRKLYNLYDNKISLGKEAAEGLNLLKRSVAVAGYKVVVGRGDAKGF